MTKEELIAKGYVPITYKEVHAMKTDIAVLSIPRQVVCEDLATYNKLLAKLRECHIGTSSRRELLTITS